MSPEDLARVHAAAMLHERAWSAAEFRDLLAAGHTHVTPGANGFALWRAVAGEAELLTIAVLPEAQGRGTGFALMQAWQTAAAAQARAAFLEVAADNMAARALYAKCAYVQVAVRPGYYRRSVAHVDALILRRGLPAPDRPNSHPASS
ncbi:MAG: GNAT family N-acetyltransferase [Pseudomonadota bacterium]